MVLIIIITSDISKYRIFFCNFAIFLLAHHRRKSWQLRLRKKRSTKKTVSVEDLPELVGPEFLPPALKDVVVPAGATAKFMCKV